MSTKSVSLAHNTRFRSHILSTDVCRPDLGDGTRFNSIRGEERRGGGERKGQHVARRHDTHDIKNTRDTRKYNSGVDCHLDELWKSTHHLRMVRCE
mmetsp:Transcript_29964/g.74320  ORF Transcript_29964/g.74320 Transcript_29964/m.74320 type:complete len:96 (+) Transcript_29964:1148-1435(+)